MKKLFIILTLCCAIIFAASLPSVAKMDTITCKFSHVLPMTHHLSRGVQIFSDLVYSRTNGRMKIDVYPAGQLGIKDNKSIEATSTGVVDGALAPAIYLTSIVPEMGIFDLPYLMPQYQKMYKVLDTAEIMDSLSAKTEKKGLKILGWFSYGYGILTSNKGQIKKPSECKGFKMRANNEIIADTLEAFGAKSAFFSGGEQYMIYQRGTVDGGHAGITSLWTRKLYEVVKNVTIDNHNAVIYSVSFNLKFWNSIPKDIQNILTVTAKDVGAWTRVQGELDDNNYLNKLSDKGLKVYRPTPEEMSKFISVTQKVRDKHIQRIGEPMKKWVDMINSW